MGKARYLAKAVQEDALADRKMAFLSGPRQVGKTYLAKTLLVDPANYRSWDQPAFRRSWSHDAVAALAELGDGPVVLDEIHKDRLWKSRLKGVFDTMGDRLPLIITGSARLDIYRRGGDSLMGRYLPYRVHPFTVGERARPRAPDEIFEGTKAGFPWEDLVQLGGFPEPLLAGSVAKARRWSRLRLDRLVREDARDLRAISDLNALRVLVDILPERVASPLSINSLREDVGVAYATVRDWVQVLEALYHCFLIRPWAKSIKRSLTQEPKLYLFDPLPILDPAARLENLAALHLLKACDYWTDTAQGDFRLHYLRNRERQEVDFLVVRDRKPWILVECKTGDTQPSPVLASFREQLDVERAFQLVHKPGYQKRHSASKIEVIDYEAFFSAWV
jgi:predicted AAA+ superfamily ATPase